MKTTNKLLLAAAVAVSLTTANVMANEPLLSPRAKSNQIQAAPAAPAVTECCTMGRGVLAGSPKGREQAESLRKVAGTTENTIDRSLMAGNAKAREASG